MEDSALRQQIMRNNDTYYRTYLRPDALVRNALVTALGTAGIPASLPNSVFTAK
jgi:hypothetical protein